MIPDKLTAHQLALCANSFFRHRHDTRARFKNAKKRHNRVQQVSVNTENVAMARQYARAARAAGFRGRFIDAAATLRRGGLES